VGWNYLTNFRLEMPLQFPWHGYSTTHRDTVQLVSESETGIFGFMRTVTGYQNASSLGDPGVYLQAYTNGVPQGSVLVQEYGGSNVSGTLIFDVTGDPATGGSRVQTFWGDRLLEDTVSATALSAGTGTYHHPAAYVVSDPSYVASYNSGNTTLGFAESVRVGPLGGRAYGSPDAQGESHSRGARTWNFADWWAAMGYAIPGLSGMTSAWNNVKRGVWAGYVFPGAHWTVNSAGMMWGDGVTDVRTPPHFNDYLQLYVFGESAGSGRIAAVTDAAGRTKVSWVNAAGTSVLFQLRERADLRATWGAEVTVYSGTDCSTPALAAYDDGTVTCWYMVSSTQHASLSTDDGRTWTELTGMMGSSLRNVAVTQHHGITFGVGVSGSSLYFVRSNDQGRTQDAQPGGDAMQLVGACDGDTVPAICCYPDGEVAVWAEDDNGAEVCYVNSTSGYGSWSQVS
jgi:hypothetical protein